MYPFCGSKYLEDHLAATIIATVTVLGTVIYERCITVIAIIGRNAVVDRLLVTVQRTDTTEAGPHAPSQSVMIRKAITLESLEMCWMAGVALVYAVVKSR